MLPKDRAEFDRHMMAIALRMGKRGLGTTAPNPAVGAVIADESTGEIIARGWTLPGGRPHAETEALRRAGARARGATMYVTLEPCSHHGKTPPCADAIVEAGIGRVVAAIEDPDPRVAGRGLERLRQAGIVVERGVLAREAHWLTRGHIVRVTERRPLVQLKLALAADGAVPRGAKGKPVWVTGPTARARGHLLRAETDAILVGHGTVVDDDPELTCRLPGLEPRSPVRVVLASRCEGLERSKLVSSAHQRPLWVVTAAGVDPALKGGLEQAGAEVVAVPEIGGRLWLPAVMEELVARGITRLLVEGGPVVWRSFFSAGLVDEIDLFHAWRPGRPALSEAEARCALSAFADMAGFGLAAHQTLDGDDLFIFTQDWRSVSQPSGGRAAHLSQ